MHALYEVVPTDRALTPTHHFRYQCPQQPTPVIMPSIATPTNQLNPPNQVTRPRPTHSPKDSTLSVSNSSSVPGDTHLLGNARDLEKGGGPDWAAARSQLPPKWVDVVDKMDELVKGIEGQMKQLSALHRKRLLVSFDDSAEGRKEKYVRVLLCTDRPMNQKIGTSTHRSTNASNNPRDTQHQGDRGAHGGHHGPLPRGGEAAGGRGQAAGG